MSDESVAALLDSDEPLVVVEAPAGCGKTYQGAHYAKRVASTLAYGRVLILTHTHAACAAFAVTTTQVSRKVEIRTIDSLIVNIASAYHLSLGLPPDAGGWATMQGQDGFTTLAEGVARLLSRHRMVASALACRYPIVIADEHQDSTAAQHAIVMALREAGARLRVFGDPMQCIFSHSTTEADQRWDALRAAGSFDELDTPHRWETGSPALGRWVLDVREALKAGGAVEIPDQLPRGLSVHYAENNAPRPSGYACCTADRRPIDRIVNAGDSLLVLTGSNDLAGSLRAFWNRRIPLWEGHSREALTELVRSLTQHEGDAAALAGAVNEFLSSTAVGFSASAFGVRFQREAEQGCTAAARGKPARLQRMARHLVDEPDHRGVSKCLGLLDQLREQDADGFGAIVIDHRSEFRDAIRLGSYASAAEAVSELHRRRTFARPMPPPRAISTIHKAKGLECDNALLIPCDRSRFGDSSYARCRLYVALSRAKTSLSLVLSRSSPCSLVGS
jgi:AAA domain/UvrD-like helicase C-terminal domain